MVTYNSKYGLLWPHNATDLDIEIACIRRGGTWLDGNGVTVGAGLFHHFKCAMTLLWPTDDWHRWADLCLQSFVKNDITVLCGAADSGKTYIMSKFVLVDWWAFPNQTLWMISSTEYRGAELRIWGCIKNLFNRAKDRWGDDVLCGTVLESMHAITTESISDDRSRARSLQRGLIFVPCKKGSEYVGLSAFVGVKAPRLRHAGDEVQFMEPSFLTAYSNWYGKLDFKGLMAGNPKDLVDPLCQACEPEGGWTGWMDTGKTQEWTSRFYGAHAIALDGRDTPNNDFPQDPLPKYTYLVGKKKIDAVTKFYGQDSPQVWSQCIGKPNANLMVRRVLTRQLCLEHHAFDLAEWLNTDHTHVYGLDPNYGGDDRCVGTHLEFGSGLDGKNIIKFYPPDIIPVGMRRGALSAEDQIALWVKGRLLDLGIPPENCFYDATGKGTMGGAFSRVYGPMGLPSPIPVDSGAQPTERPVRYDYYVDDGNDRRLKTCREEYSKFVTEMWFSVREAVESDQVREFKEDVLYEFTMRKYEEVKGNKTEVEPKDKLKERMGLSPDLADSSAIAMEGARQRGFRITRAGDGEYDESKESYFEAESELYNEALKGVLLVHA